MGIEIRPFEPTDIPALQAAIDRDTFHPGEWSVKHFYDDPNDPDALKIPKEATTMSDSKGLTLYASTPQSKTGFAPFSIGFMIFSLSLCGGSSGGGFNPGRLLGPAIFSGKVKYLWLYWAGEFFGAACAGALVGTMHSYGLSHAKGENQKTATEAVKEVLKTSAMTAATPSTSSSI